MSEAPELEEKYGATLAALTEAMLAGDEPGLLALISRLQDLRDSTLCMDLRALTANLQLALDRFSVDSRLADLAEKEVPDARHRLGHVLRMTDAAAHTTLDLVERSGPLAERTALRAAELWPLWAGFRARKITQRDFQVLLAGMDAFLPAARADSEQVRNNLAEVLLAQGYQDLSGQLIRGVMQLVNEIETVLVALMQLAAAGGDNAVRPAARHAGVAGPVVPGIEHGNVVSGQQDVDALLSGLGM